MAQDTVQFQSCLLLCSDEAAAARFAAMIADSRDVSFQFLHAATLAEGFAALKRGKIAVCFLDADLYTEGSLEFAGLHAALAEAIPLVALIHADREGGQTTDLEAAAADVLFWEDLSPPLLSHAMRHALRDVNTQKTHREQQYQRAALSAELQVQSDLLRLALDNTKHGIAMFDQDGRLIVHNARYLEIYGFSPERVHPHMTIREILDYSIELGNYTDDEAARMKSERVLQISQQANSTYEQHLRDGRVVAVNHQPMRNGRSVTTCEDITETLQRERATAELARSAALADAAHEAKSAFLSNMSHELKTPLNAIIGFSQVMVEEQFGEIDNPNYLAYAKDICDSGRRLLRIVDQTLDMALLYDGDALLEETACDPVALLTDVLSDFKDAAEAKHLTMRLSDNAAKVSLCADRAKLALAIGSVVENAVKFSLPHSLVVASVKRGEDGALVVSVSDTGIGIPEDEIERILSAFGQVEGAYARQHQGAGLGLSIADGFVRLHGGKIEIESTQNVGTTVRILLPAQRILANQGPVSNTDDTQEQIA